MRMSGACQDSGRALCYGISIGCTTLMCSTMPLLSIRTHLSHSQTGVTPSSRFGCRVQTAVQLMATNPPLLLLRELGMLGFRYNFHSPTRLSWFDATTLQ